MLWDTAIIDGRSGIVGVEEYMHGSLWEVAHRR